MSSEKAEMTPFWPSNTTKLGLTRQLQRELRAV